jgi:hypothetical protein
MPFQESTVSIPKVRIAVDFPPLPSVIGRWPGGDIAPSREMVNWYESLKTTVLDKLNSLASQINTGK